MQIPDYSRTMNDEGIKVPVPLQVHSCGHYVLGKSFRDNPMHKPFIELFWGIRGAANVGFNGKVFQLEPQTVFFYLPGDFHDITTSKAPLEYCWFTLDGDNVGNLVEQFQLKQEIIRTDVCPVHLFRQMEHRIISGTREDAYMTSALAYLILTLALAGEPGGKPLFTRFREILESRYGNPDLRIESVAQELKVHQSTLARCVLSMTGMTPREYLEDFRIREACRLIRGTKCLFKEIAIETGFSDPAYFGKVIRRKTGMTPAAIRRSGGESILLPEPRMII